MDDENYHCHTEESCYEVCSWLGNHKDWSRWSGIQRESSTLARKALKEHIVAKNAKKNSVEMIERQDEARQAVRSLRIEKFGFDLDKFYNRFCEKAEMMRQL
jgi:hypothetical protein